MKWKESLIVLSTFPSCSPNFAFDNSNVGVESSSDITTIWLACELECENDARLLHWLTL